MRQVHRFYLLLAAALTLYVGLISLQIPRGQGRPRVVTTTTNHANSNDIHSFFSVIV